MLAKPQNDLFYFLTILESIGKIDSYLKGITSANDFIEKDDQIYFNATLTLLTYIGEVFGKISEDSKKYFSSKDLIGIRGVRNKIVHDYTGIDSFRIFEIIQNNIPALKNKIHKIISIYLENEIINLEEYNIAKNSKFYKHIDFI